MTKSLRKSLFTIAILTASAGTIAVAAGLNPFAAKSARPATQPVAVVPSFDQPKPAAPNGHRNVDIVFAVDTTGSMTQLIEGAKATVWSIAKHTQKMAPNAKIRIGLVAYRDIGEAYVTKTFQLSDDLDAAFAELSAYSAMGGGDVPENVNKALDEAINHMRWDDNAAKMVFLVGDAPGAERGDAPVLSTLTAQANAKHITINAIRCGDDAATASEFKQLAMAAGGEFSSIAQSGGVQQIATPYDAKLAELADWPLIGPDQDRATWRALAATGFDAPRKQFVVRSDNDLMQLAAVRAGLGIGVFQLPLAAKDPNLERVLPRFSLSLEMFVVMHEDQRKVPRVRRVFDHLVTELAAYGASRRS